MGAVLNSIWLAVLVCFFKAARSADVPNRNTRPYREKSSAPIGLGRGTCAVECKICEVRSSVGYCVECRALLCETCGVPCEQCRKISCPTHTHTTRSGKVLCAGCYAERRAKREAVKAEVVHRQHARHGEPGDTSLAGLEAAPEAEGEVRDEALVASARGAAVQPWQMSLYIALVGIALGIALILFPSIRHVAFGARTYSIGYIVFVFVVLSAVWAWIGLRNEEYYRDRIKCFYGVGACIVCALVGVVTVSRPPVTEERPVSATVELRRGDETAEELEEWRQRALQKYSKPAGQ